MSSEYEFEKVIDLMNVPFMDIDGIEAVNTAMSRNKGKLALVRVGENQFPVLKRSEFYRDLVKKSLIMNESSPDDKLHVEFERARMQ